MNRLNAARLWVAVLISSLFIVFTYEVNEHIKADPYIRIVLIAIAWILGIITAKPFGELLLKIRWVRKVICRDEWVEGYWLIETKGIENRNHPLYPLGILYLRYSSERYELVASTSRLNQEGKIYVVNSEVAYLRERSVKKEYINYFRIEHDETNRSGVAHGRLSEISKKQFVITDTIYLQNEAVNYNQTAYRIDFKNFRKLRRKFGEDWILEVLKEDGDYQKCLKKKKGSVNENSQPRTQ